MSAFAIEIGLIVLANIVAVAMVLYAVFGKGWLVRPPPRR